MKKRIELVFCLLDSRLGLLVKPGGMIRRTEKSWFSPSLGPGFALPFLLRLVLGGAALLPLAGCADQAEGERCDPKNNNLDCEGNLICTSLRSLNAGTEGAICCPASGGSGACSGDGLQFEPDGNDDDPTDDSEPAEPTTEPQPPAEAGAPEAGAAGDAATAD